MGNGLMIGVIGARGGAGTSSVAAAVTWGLVKQGAAAVLVDLDLTGGGIDVLLGMEQTPGIRWGDLHDAQGELDGAQLRARLPVWGAVPVLSAARQAPAPVPPDAVIDVCAALSEVTVLDLPRAVLDNHQPWAQPVATLCHEVLIVTPLDIPAVAGAVAARDHLASWGVHCTLVARRPAPGRLHPQDVAHGVGLDLAAVVGHDKTAAHGVDRGAGPPIHGRTPLARAGRDIAARYPHTWTRPALTRIGPGPTQPAWAPTQVTPASTPSPVPAWSWNGHHRA